MTAAHLVMSVDQTFWFVFAITLLGILIEFFRPH
jgi:hypothetical protein